MANPRTFVVSDQSVNSYGFVVLTGGIRTEHFEANPVCLWNHADGPAVGRWTNLRRDGERLLADLEFDMDDPFAANLAKKVEKGFVKSASVGLRVLKTQNATLAAGQRRPTVTESELLEISLVNIPSNKRAVALYDAAGAVLNLSDEAVLSAQALPVIEDHILKKVTQPNDMEELKPLVKTLALSDTATAADIQNAVAELAEKNRQLEGRFTALREREIKTLLDAAVGEKRIGEQARPEWERLLKDNFDTASAVLAKTSPVVKLSDFVKPGPDASGEADLGEPEMKYKGKTFEQWSKDKPEVLHQLKDTDPVTFKALFKSQYGVDYKG